MITESEDDDNESTALLLRHGPLDVDPTLLVDSKDTVLLISLLGDNLSMSVICMLQFSCKKSVHQMIHSNGNINPWYSFNRLMGISNK